MYDQSSRYYGQETYTVMDRRGRLVTVVTPAGALTQTLLGYHQRRQGQRLDHLAYKYLGNATLFWRLCEFNDVMLAEALGEADEIGIPKK
ncbi:MAG: hypothetical protein ABSF99_08605 [Anaerolineales bacterium]|jgi:hypothetical protein